MIWGHAERPDRCPCGRQTACRRPSPGRPRAAGRARASGKGTGNGLPQPVCPEKFLGASLRLLRRSSLPEDRGQLSAELPRALQVPLVGVCAVQAPGKPEWAPRVEPPAGELRHDVESLAGQQFLQGRVPRASQQRQAGRGEHEGRPGGLGGVGQAANPVEERPVHPAVIHTGAEPEEPVFVQARVWRVFRAGDDGISADRSLHRLGNSGSVPVMLRLAQDEAR